MDIFFNIILYLGLFIFFSMTFGLNKWLKNKYITFRMNKHKHPFLWWDERFNRCYYATYDVDKYYFQ